MRIYFIENTRLIFAAFVANLNLTGKLRKTRVSRAKPVEEANPLNLR